MRGLNFQLYTYCRVSFFQLKISLRQWWKCQVLFGLNWGIESWTSEWLTPENGGVEITVGPLLLIDGTKTPKLLVKDEFLKGLRMDPRRKDNKGWTTWDWKKMWPASSSPKPHATQQRLWGQMHVRFCLAKSCNTSH